jgi:hypothetical protein
VSRSSSGSSCVVADRILWLRVRLIDGEPAEGIVHGVRHRRPVDLRVGADTVRRLLAEGVPAVATAHRR